MTNLAVLVQPVVDAQDLLEEIGELIPPKVPFLLISPWPSPDFRDHGLSLAGTFPLMYRPAGAPTQGAQRSGVDVREVLDTRELALAERIFIEGYPMSQLSASPQGAFLPASLLDGPTRLWLAWVDGEPAAASIAHYGLGLQLVQHVASLPSARGRGAGIAVSWAATLGEPDRPAVLVASDDGRPIYASMGYVPIEMWSGWLRPAL